MITIEKIGNLDGLLSMTAYLDKMKPKSVIMLFAKICEVSKGQDISKNEKFRQILEFV